MKKPILLFLLFLVFACTEANKSNGTNDLSQESKVNVKEEKESSKSEEEIVSDIRQKFQEINQNESSFQTKSNEILGESAEGGELKGYYQNEKLKKLVVSYYGEMGKLIEEYYFTDDQLFFTFTQRYSYDKPITIEDSQVKSIEENRYYFSNDKLVRWLDPNKEKVAPSKFSEKELAIVQQSKKLKKQLGGIASRHIDIKSLFELSPLSVFNETTEGLSLSEKNDLLKKGESDSWKIVEESKTKLSIQCKYPSSQVKLYFLPNSNNSDGILFAETQNEQNNKLQSWKYSHSDKTIQELSVLKKYDANAFVDEKDQLPKDYEANLNYQFIDDQTIEVSLNTWMQKEFENREIRNRIFLKWNGKTFDEKIEEIKK